MSQPNTVVVTGAAGHLGSHLIPLLVAEGFRIRGLDIVEPKKPLLKGAEFFKADLIDAGQLRPVFEGSDIIVHCASIHPWKKYTDEQYLDNNIKGTWVLYSTAAELGIDKIVLTSSIAASGTSGIPVEAWPVSEDAEFVRGGLYCVTKHTQEDIARHFADHGKVRTIALRPPAFMPLADAWTTGRWLLAGMYSVVEDVAAPHVNAVRVFAGVQEPGAPLAAFEAFNITNQPPFTKEDVAELGPDANLGGLVKKYWPDAYEWLIAKGWDPSGLPVVFDNSKVKRALGWQAEHNFQRWFAENRDT